MPLNDTSEAPGPQAWVSMRPCMTPRGVGNFCDDRMTASGKPVVYSSISGTVAVLCTYRKWAESTLFSAISWSAASTTYDVRIRVDQSGSSANSGTSGMSHIGGSPSGWYQLSTTPL